LGARSKCRIDDSEKGKKKKQAVGSLQLLDMEAER
jgi:hypothetical protein